MCMHSRRDFLVRSAAAGALALGANRLPIALAADVAPEKTDMTIAKWAGAKDPSAEQLKQIAVKLTEKAIEGLGGIARFVKKGDVVWVKPNIGWDRTPELAGNTNPEVVATIVKMCFDAGAKAVKIGDNPVHAAPKTYPASGIPAAVKSLGAEMVFLDKNRYKETAINGERVKTLLLYPDIIDCDLVINIPIVKHHVLSNATLCMKNYMGVMDNRQPFHQDFATCLTDLTRFMKPRLCVLDAVRVLKEHGPSGGKMEDVVVKTTVAAGVDIVALDALGVELLGKDPAETKKAASIIKAAQEGGLGKADYRSLALREIAVS
jgi:uncharacterized protein (DUF362 family)